MAADVHIYLPDELYGEVKEADLPVSQIAQDAFRRELAKRHLAASAEELEIELWTPGETRYLATFSGVWLVEDHPDETRAAEEGWDAGAYFGVALIEGGDFLIYRAHVNERWAPSYEVFADLEDAELPGNIFVEAALAFNELLANNADDARWTRQTPYEVKVPLRLY